jgi:splicing suppressor protein 51
VLTSHSAALCALGPRDDACQGQHFHHTVSLTTIHSPSLHIDSGRAQPYCSTCYRSANQLASRDIVLKACTHCRMLHHCGGCPDSHSKAVCTAYQTQNKIEQFRHELFEDSGKASAITCTQVPHKTYKNLAACAGWYDYYVKISDKGYIKGNIQDDFGAISASAARQEAARQEFEEQRRMFLLLATDTLTMPLTIVSAMEDLQMLDTATLKVHLLGATGREFLAMSCFEEILHLAPSIKHLDITAVGPSSMLHGHGPEGYAQCVSVPRTDPTLGILPGSLPRFYEVALLPEAEPDRGFQQWMR